MNLVARGIIRRFFADRNEVFDLGIPVLGICYGAQLIAHTLNGKVEHAEKGEYGKRESPAARHTR